MSQAAREARATAVRAVAARESVDFFMGGKRGEAALGQATVKSSGLKSMRLAWETASLMARTARQHL